MLLVILGKVKGIVTGSATSLILYCIRALP